MATADHTFTFRERPLHHVYPPNLPEVIKLDRIDHSIVPVFDNQRCVVDSVGAWWRDEHEPGQIHLVRLLQLPKRVGFVITQVLT